MKYLLWETSGIPWGVGVAEADCGKSILLAQREDAGARSLAAQLLNTVDQVLTEANTDLSCIDTLAVSIGPGSWTGLRIGLTAAKTMAQILSLPLVGVATFDIFAQALQQQEDGGKLLLIQAPCRPGEKYAKLWHCHGTERDLLEAEWIGSDPQIAERLKFWAKERNASGVVIGGSEPSICLPQGSPLTPEYRESVFSRRLQSLGQLAAIRAGQEQWDDALRLQPVYLAPSAAEREYDAKHGRSAK